MQPIITAIPKRLFGNVQSPCTYNWENMTGDERVRFCSLCKMNVYNLAELTIVEATDLIKESDGRLCVQIKKRPDGSIYTDNCPYRLRKMRNIVRRWAPWAMLFISWIFHQTPADGQGLVGAPVDGRFGQGGEIDMGSVAVNHDQVVGMAAALAAFASATMSVVAVAWLNRAWLNGARMAWNATRFSLIRRYMRLHLLAALICMLAVPLLVYSIVVYLNG